MTARILAFILGHSIFLGACASTLPAVGPEPAGADDAQDACERYAERMCETLSPKSRACDAVRRVGLWMAPQACVLALRDVAVSEERIATLRTDCDEVSRRLCEKVEGDSDVCDGVKRDIAAISPEECAGLRKAYPEVERGLLAKVARERPLDQETQQALLAGSPPSAGPADAKVAVVVFSDFQCPYCSRAAAAMNALRERYPKRVRFVFRHFPLSFHKNAHRAAEAALAAHAEGKFWEFHDLLFVNQTALGTDALVGYAKSLGLDSSALAEGLSSGAFRSAVDADLELGERVHVSGTPSMFINGRKVENASDVEGVAAAIEAALAASTVVASTPTPTAESAVAQ